MASVAHALHRLSNPDAVVTIYDGNGCLYQGSDGSVPSDVLTMVIHGFVVFSKGLKLSPCLSGI